MNKQDTKPGSAAERALIQAALNRHYPRPNIDQSQAFEAGWAECRAALQPTEQPAETAAMVQPRESRWWEVEGIQKEAMYAANALLMDMIGKPSWDRPCAAKHIMAYAARQSTEAAPVQPEAAQDERERFEAWHRSTHAFTDYTRREDGEYDDWDISISWRGWQAAKRDALTQAPQERAAVTDEGLRKLIADDAFAMSFQSLEQYRRALLSQSSGQKG